MEKYIIPNLRNACLVLQRLAAAPSPLTTREIAADLDLPRTSAMRILTTLTAEGFVSKKHERFELGPSLIGIGSAAKSRLDMGEVARPILRKVTEQTGETCHLAVPSGNRSLIVEVNTSPHPLSSSRGPGALVELHCSATGKCFLAFVHWPRIDAVLGERDLASHTALTITTMARLATEIEQVRVQRFAIDEQEFFEGVRCIAAPVFDADDKCVAAFGVTASTTRFTLGRVDEFCRILKSAAGALSSQLGWRGSLDAAPSALVIEQ